MPEKEGERAECLELSENEDKECLDAVIVVVDWVRIVHEVIGLGLSECFASEAKEVIGTD